MAYKGHTPESYIDTMPYWKFRERLKQLDKYIKKTNEETEKISKGAKSGSGNSLRSRAK